MSCSHYDMALLESASTLSQSLFGGVYTFSRSISDKCFLMRAGKSRMPHVSYGFQSAPTRPPSAIVMICFMLWSPCPSQCISATSLPSHLEPFPSLHLSSWSCFSFIHYISYHLFAMLYSFTHVSSVILAAVVDLVICMCDILLIASRWLWGNGSKGRWIE